MKGIILSAGKATRLAPVSLGTPKALLPVYDKPLIYYSLSLLVSAGIRDILIITSPTDGDAFRKLLGDGSRFGVRLEYAIQPVPKGIADAFVIGEDFIGDDSVALALSDNIFHDPKGELEQSLKTLPDLSTGGLVCALQVEDPRPFGVLEFDSRGEVIAIEEKPAHPKSNWIVPGLYCYDSRVCGFARELKPSARGELEVTDLHNIYLRMGALRVLHLPKGTFWLDAGNADSLLDAGNAVRKIWMDEGVNPGCIEEASFRRGYLSLDQLKCAGESMAKTKYGQYLLSLADRLG